MNFRPEKAYRVLNTVIKITPHQDLSLNFQNAGGKRPSGEQDSYIQKIVLYWTILLGPINSVVGWICLGPRNIWTSEHHEEQSLGTKLQIILEILKQTEKKKVGGSICHLVPEQEHGNQIIIEQPIKVWEKWFPIKFLCSNYD